MGHQATDDFDEGALFIAVLDPKSQHMIWVGVAEARLLPNLSYERTLGRIDDAVSQILERFPPG